MREHDCCFSFFVVIFIALLLYDSSHIMLNVLRQIRWVIGSISDIMGQDIPGTYTALTPCRVHHLPFESIEDLEVENPVLVLHLYKLLSHLAARRQEMTIGQLATLRSIMSATAPTKPISRSKMRAIDQSF